MNNSIIMKVHNLARLFIFVFVMLQLSACASVGTLKPGQLEAQRSALREAELLYQSDQYAEAKIQFEKIAAQAGGSAEAEFRLGNIAMRSENVEQALSHYRKTLELKPDSPKAHYNLATAYLTQSEQHFHYYTATSQDETQQQELFPLLGAIEAFSTEKARQPSAEANSLDGLAEALTQQRQLQ